MLKTHNFRLLNFPPLVKQVNFFFLLFIHKFESSLTSKLDHFNSGSTESVQIFGIKLLPSIFILNFYWLMLIYTVMDM